MRPAQNKSQIWPLAAPYYVGLYLEIYEEELSIVQRIRDNFGWNRALCDKSTKFGTVEVYGKVTILKIGGTLKMP